MIEVNKVYCDDNLNILKQISNNFIDVIYIDPPFSTGRIFKTTDGEVAYEDKYTLQELLDILEPRIVEIHRVLKESGMFYIHGDYRFIPYVRVMCDKIFGINNFRNEIIWKYGLGGSGNRQFSKKHDTILFYSKTDNYVFNLLYEEATSNKMKGQLKKMTDVWDIPNINNMAKERTGYPTQKPIELLERILKASLKFDEEINTYSGIVADFFAGSGTTLKVAKDLGVDYIGCDSSEVAVKYINERLN